MRVHEVGEEASERVRALRLRALADAPDAFFSTAEEEEGWSEQDWRRWVGDGGVFVAEDDAGVWCGLAVGRGGKSPGAASLLSLWVAPEHRRRRVGTLLVRAVVDWATRSGFGHLELWVERTNVAARRFYQGAGFRATGREWIRPRDQAVEEQLALALVD